MRLYWIERIWVVKFAFILFLVTLLPYLFGYQQEDPDWKFSGFVIGVEDGNSYVAKMMRGAAGEVLFETPYTAFPQSGLITFIPYTLLGKLASGLEIHDQMIGLFQIFRFIGCVLMSLATYDLIGLFIGDIDIRRKALIFAMVGGGLGWLAILGLGQLWTNGLPLEFYSPETFGFLSAFSLPHLAVSRALLLWGFFFYLKEVPHASKFLKNAWITGTLWLVMGFFQPLAIVTGWLVLAVHLIVRAIVNVLRNMRGHVASWSNWLINLRQVVIIGFISSPWVIYNLICSYTDFYLQGWASQNIILSPPIIDYVLAFIPIIPFVAISIWEIAKTQNSKSIFLIGWMAAFPILAYFPYQLQRRLPEGIWVGMTILGFLWMGKLSENGRKWVTPFVLFSLLPAIGILMGSIASLQTKSEPVFISQNEIRCYQAVQQNANVNDVVMASYETGNALPAWAPVKVLIGHGPESIKLQEVQPLVHQIYQSSTLENERVSIMKKFDVKYIYWGRHEASLGDWKPTMNQGYHLIYENEFCSVWRVSGAEH